MGKKQNSNKQGKRIKKLDEAKEQADAIIEAAKAKAVKASQDREAKEKKKAVKQMGLPTYPEVWDEERKEGSTDVEWLTAISVRLLRDEGEPWWAIAKALEMEGAGDSATTGKRGAARARTAYAAGFGSHPRTFTRGAYKGAQEQNTHVAALKKQKASDLKAKAKSGKSVISKKMPDADLAAMLKGRKIRWFSNLTVPEGLDQEAAIHATAPFYIEGEGKHRTIQFREQHRRAPIEFRGVPAQWRTVRVSQIYSVK